MRWFAVIAVFICIAAPPVCGAHSITLVASVPHTVDGEGAKARFARPEGLAFDSKGNLYVADSRDHVIRRITPSGVVTTFIGMPGQPGDVDGTGASARLASPHGLVIDSRDYLYVADSANEAIRRISQSGEVSTVVRLADLRGRDRAAINADMGNPQGIAIDRRDTIYLTSRSVIVKLTQASKVTAPAAWGRSTVENYPEFSSPRGLVLDARGNMYVADAGKFVVWEKTLTGQVKAFAGKPDEQGTADGDGKMALFDLPEGIVTDHDGNFYVTDCGGNSVRVISPSGFVRTIVGNGNHRQDGELPRVVCPRGIAIDSSGSVYFTAGGPRPDGQWDGSVMKILADGRWASFAGPQ